MTWLDDVLAEAARISEKPYKLTIALAFLAHGRSYDVGVSVTPYGSSFDTGRPLEWRIRDKIPNFKAEEIEAGLPAEFVQAKKRRLDAEADVKRLFERFSLEEGKLHTAATRAAMLDQGFGFLNGSEVRDIARDLESARGRLEDVEKDVQRLLPEILKPEGQTWEIPAADPALVAAHRAKQAGEARERIVKDVLSCVSYDFDLEGEELADVLEQAAKLARASKEGT